MKLGFKGNGGEVMFNLRHLKATVKRRHLSVPDVNGLARGVNHRHLHVTALLS